jgi:hypothetical protein
MRISLRAALLLLFLLGSAGLVVAIYWQSLSYPFQFDDFSNIVHNRSIRYLEHPRILMEHAQSRPRPLTSLTYAVNYKLSGLSLSSYRLGNLLLHWLNGLLVALLFLQWFRGRRQSGRGGSGAGGRGIFLAYPLAVDGVVISIRALLSALAALFAPMPADSGNESAWASGLPGLSGGGGGWAF